MSLEKLFEEFSDSGYADDLPSFKVVDEEDWSIDGGDKYQYKTTIVKSNETGKLFSIDEIRTGSPYSDYYYGDTELREVTERIEMRVVTSYDSVGESVTVKGD